jgi:hypothetical protein
MNLKRGNKGQVTIFIIIGILAVAFIVLIFVYINKSNNTKNSDFISASPGDYLSNCMEDKLHADMETLSLQGGYFDNPLSIRFKFTEDGDVYRNISYLCYSEGERLPCVMQQPSILNNLEKELENSLAGTAEDCFNQFLQSLETDGYNVTGTYNGINVDIQEKKIALEIDSKLTYSKGEQSESVDKIAFEYSSEIYGIGKTVERILNDEMEKDSFDRFDYMEKHPQYNIDYVVPESRTKIYTVINENTNEKFRFAVKGGFY